MEDSLSIIFAIFVALIIMFIVPLMDAWELQDNLSYVIVYAACTDFVDTVRNTGYISLDNYSNFESRLLSTGNTFSISLEHRQLNYLDEPVYLNTYTNTIYETIRQGNIYPLNKGDYFYVTVKNTNKTQASIITNMVAHDSSNFKIGCAYGGCVWALRDEY